MCRLTLDAASTACQPHAVSCSRTRSLLAAGVGKWCAYTMSSNKVCTLCAFPYPLQVCLVVPLMHHTLAACRCCLPSSRRHSGCVHPHPLVAHAGWCKRKGWTCAATISQRSAGSRETCLRCQWSMCSQYGSQTSRRLRVSQYRVCLPFWHHWLQPSSHTAGVVNQLIHLCFVCPCEKLDMCPWSCPAGHHCDAAHSAPGPGPAQLRGGCFCVQTTALVRGSAAASRGGSSRA